MKSKMNSIITISERTTGGGHGGITVDGVDYVHYDLAAEWKGQRDWLLEALMHARDNCIGHPDQIIDEVIAKAENS